MKKELMKILACPRCKGELKLEVMVEDGDEIISGRLDCAACKLSYPIEDGIPNLLPPELRSDENA